MTYLVAQIWAWLLVALVLGIVIGWLWTRLSVARRTEERIAEWRERATALERERDQLRRERGEVRQLPGPEQQTAEPTAAEPEVAELPAEAVVEQAPQPGAAIVEDETGALTAAEAPAGPEPESMSDRSYIDDPGPQPMQSEPVAPALSASPESDDAPGDDLTRIRGIGRALEQRLIGLGIRRYEQIASLGPGDIARIDQALGFRARVTRDRWVEQARELLATQSGPTNP